MPEEPYKNREIVEMFEDVKKDLTEIKVQTTTTNGKVADINKWRERMNGGAVVAGFFMTTIVLPILGWAIYVLVNVNNTIHKSVDEAISAYQITTR